MRRSFALFLLAAVPALACTTYSEGPKCTVGADCASGVCNANGTCADTTTTSSSGTGGAGGAGGSATSSSSSSSSSSGAGGGTVTCAPNDDGAITRQEVPLAAGLHATFRVADGATFDTAGTSNPDTSRTWDLKVAFSGDHALLLETQAIDPQAWYAADFPGATYVARLSDTNDLLGVFKLTSDALLLLGAASPMDAADATKLVYATPITVLAFPLTLSKTWDTLSAVSGKAQGIPIGGVFNDEYTSTVDAHGTLKTPFSEFPVLRINTLLKRYVNGATTVQRTHSFVTECFGTVGNIVSQPVNSFTTFGVIPEDFTSTSEIWRFAP